jgi:5-hydroxyisourate hydrolase
MSPITTHVLDTARGCPAEGVPISLEYQAEGVWSEIAAEVTNADGRIAELLAPGQLRAGVYRMTFDTGTYFTNLGIDGFYPYASIVFSITQPQDHHHIPLLLSPFGYSTYRGS